MLSRDTGVPGYAQRYGTNPYAGYDGRMAPIEGFYQGTSDSRLPAMERVAAVRIGDERIAYPFSRLQASPVLQDEVDGRPIVVFWVPETSSALDAPLVAEGRAVGSAAVFERTLNGTRLDFEPAGEDRFRDRTTGSVWDVTGRAIEGEMAGSRLTALPVVEAFWFAWAVFEPTTRIGG